MEIRKSIFSSVFPLDKPRIFKFKTPKAHLLPPRILQGKIITLAQINTLPLHQWQLLASDLYNRFKPLGSFIVEISPVLNPKLLLSELDFESIITNISAVLHYPETFLNTFALYDNFTLLVNLGLELVVSNNILVPLTPNSIKGKKYIKDEWRNAFKKTVYRKHKNYNKARNTQDIFSKKKTKKSPNAKIHEIYESKTSFFDSIKPILMPPPVIPSEKLTTLSPNFLPPGKKPHPFQVIGIKRLVENRAFLLADEMGTGKTVMATLALRILLREGKAKRILILCPVSVLRVWEEHLQEWSLGELSFVLVRGTPEQRRLIWQLDNIHVFITSYDVFSRDIRRENILIDKFHFDLVILDEAHYIKNRKSIRFRSLQQASFKRKWALTGTPLENRIEDVKTIFEFLIPGLIPAEETSPTKIREYIRPYMLRRLKKDVLSQLPPKRRQWRWLEMSKEQRRQYESVRRYGVAELTELARRGRVPKYHIFALITKLKKICNFPQGSLDSPKAREVINLVEEIVASGEKVVIFSQFIEEGIAKLAKILEGYNALKLTGNMSLSQRKTVIDAFRTNPDIRVLLVSLRAGGVGLTLTEASYIIHFDHWWNPAVMKQAEDRVHRVGQTKPVMIYDLGMEDTIERRIYEILKEKQALANQVIDDLAERIDLYNLITEEEWLYKVLQIPPDKTKPALINSESKSSISFTSTWDAKRLNQVRMRLFQIDPAHFEKLVAKLFLRFGYTAVHIQGGPSDEGIDILAKRHDATGTRFAIIQCKRYTHKKVGVKIARELAGVLSQVGKNYEGYIVTSSDFTPQCKRFVANSGGRIKLINGLELARYILQYGLEDILFG